MIWPGMQLQVFAAVTRFLLRLSARQIDLLES